MGLSRALTDGAYDANLIYPRARELAQWMEVYVVDRLEDRIEHQGPEEKHDIHQYGFVVDQLHLVAALYSSGTFCLLRVSTMGLRVLTIGDRGHLMTVVLVTAFRSHKSLAAGLILFGQCFLLFRRALSCLGWQHGLGNAPGSQEATLLNAILGQIANPEPFKDNHTPSPASHARPPTRYGLAGTCSCGRISSRADLHCPPIAYPPPIFNTIRQPKLSGGSRLGKA